MIHYNPLSGKMSCKGLNWVQEKHPYTSFTFCSSIRVIILVFVILLTSGYAAAQTDVVIQPGSMFLTVGDPHGNRDSEKEIEHVRITWIKNPSEEAVVSWTTREEGQRHRVYYDPVSRRGEPGFYRHAAVSFKDGMFTMVSEDTRWSEPGYYHHVHLENLQPSTTYYLVIESDNHLSREYHFTTAPEGDEPFAILYGGDSRIGRYTGPSTGLYPYEHNDRQKMFQQMAALVEENPDIIAFAHSGDYCLEAEWRYLDPWLTDFELVTTEAGRLLPIIPGRGNHDRQVGFEEMFFWPDLDRDYYFSTQLSEAVALITLNTNISKGGDQREWLDHRLRDLRPANRWLMVQYHYPAYNSVRNIQAGADVRTNWVPLFEKYTIDLVGESHDHALKRTVPIRADSPDFEEGIIYIGDGGLGVPQRVPDTDRWFLQEPGFAKSAHHVHMIEFGKEEMRIRAFGMEGDVLDDFTIKSRMVFAE